MTCPKCNNPVSVGQSFCAACGTDLSNLNATNEQSAINNQQETNISNEQPIVTNFQENNSAELNALKPETQDTSKNSNSSPNIIIILAALLIFGGIGWFIISSQSKKLNANNNIDTAKTNSNKSEKNESNNKSEDNKQKDTINKDENNVEKSTEKILNYRISMTISAEADGMRLKQSSSGVVDELHQREYLSIYTTLNGNGIGNEMYYDYNTGDIYTSEPGNNKIWTKQKGATEPVDQSYILSKLDDNSGVVTIDENHYQVKLSKKEMKKLMASDEFDLSLIKGDLFVDVYKENGHVVKLEYDFSDVIDGIDEFKLTVGFSSFNQAGDVVIPQEVLDGVKKM
jgi:hypothetical protein